MVVRTILETLLQGQFICSVSHSKLYQELKNDENKLTINSTLHALGRELRSTENDDTFYCAYSNIDNPKDGRLIQSQFEQLRDQIAPVVEFLTFVMRVSNSDSVLIPGDTLRFHDLLSYIEAESAHLADLSQISRYELFKKVRTKSNNQDRLKAVLEVMEKEGYVYLINKESTIYQVTGKIEYFYSSIEFIRDYEQIPLQDETDEQKEISFDR